MGEAFLAPPRDRNANRLNRTRQEERQLKMPINRSIILKSNSIYYWRPLLLPHSPSFPLPNPGDPSRLVSLLCFGNNKCQIRIQQDYGRIRNSPSSVGLRNSGCANRMMYDAWIPHSDADARFVRTLIPTYERSGRKGEFTQPMANVLLFTYLHLMSSSTPCVLWVLHKSKARNIFWLPLNFCLESFIEWIGAWGFVHSLCLITPDYAI